MVTSRMDKKYIYNEKKQDFQKRADFLWRNSVRIKSINTQ